MGRKGFSLLSTMPSLWQKRSYPLVGMTGTNKETLIHGTDWMGIQPGPMFVIWHGEAFGNLILSEDIPRSSIWHYLEDYDCNCHRMDAIILLGYPIRMRDKLLGPMVNAWKSLGPLCGRYKDIQGLLHFRRHYRRAHFVHAILLGWYILLRTHSWYLFGLSSGICICPGRERLLLPASFS